MKVAPGPSTRKCCPYLQGHPVLEGTISLGLLCNYFRAPICSGWVRSSPLSSMLPRSMHPLIHSLPIKTQYCSGFRELLQVILNLVGVNGGCDIDKFQKPFFEGQLAEELLGVSAVGVGAWWKPPPSQAGLCCSQMLEPCWQETSIAGIALV